MFIRTKTAGHSTCNLRSGGARLGEGLGNPLTLAFEQLRQAGEQLNAPPPGNTMARVPEEVLPQLDHGAALPSDDVPDTVLPDPLFVEDRASHLGGRNFSGYSLCQLVAANGHPAPFHERTTIKIVRHLSATTPSGQWNRVEGEDAHADHRHYALAPTLFAGSTRWASPSVHAAGAIQGTIGLFLEVQSLVGITFPEGIVRAPEEFGPKGKVVVSDRDHPARGIESLI